MLNQLSRVFRNNADVALVAMVLGVLLLLFAPIPAGLLDFLILLNFSFALLILLLTFYAPRPVDFSTFPAILLIATLFRLGLNVSATRLILSEGDAGDVIGAVGNYVVAGNYVIGLIVFLILVVIQYVVITNGAQRVSEVAARFTLDSLPGQQMSIDADLNMGLIDQEEAQARRKNLEREAAFYGAMDGASKFVKGDAIAGIVILLINIVGGLIIGVVQHEMPWGDALRQYTLLTIGDGLVTQIPALIISVGTGLIVTRSASDVQLANELVRQITSFPRTLAMVTVAMLCVALLPGLPLLPIAIIAGLLGITYFFLRRKKKQELAADAESDAAAAGEKDHYAIYESEAIEIQLGGELARFLGGEKGSLMERIGTFREQFANEMGCVMPKVRFRESQETGTQEYRIQFYGDMVGSGSLMMDRTLAIHPTGDVSLVPGIETRDPAYGLAALWVDDSQREAARVQRYTLVDPATVLFTHLCEVVRQHASSLLTRGESEKMLARLRTSQPGLVEELIPTVLTLSDVQKVLQNLLKEKVPVRNLQAIVESLIDGARTSKDASYLTEITRQRLGAAICNTLSSDQKTIHVMTLHPDVEYAFMARGEGSTASAAVDPHFTETLLRRVAGAAEKMMKSNLLPVILCAPEVRRQIRALCERAAPNVRVISVAEVPSHFELRAFASVSVQPQVS